MNEADLRRSGLACSINARFFLLPSAMGWDSRTGFGLVWFYWLVGVVLFCFSFFSFLWNERDLCFPRKCEQSTFSKSCRLWNRWWLSWLHWGRGKMAEPWNWLSLKEMFQLGQSFLKMQKTKTCLRSFSLRMKTQSGNLLPVWAYYTVLSSPVAYGFLHSSNLKSLRLFEQGPRSRA